MLSILIVEDDITFSLMLTTWLGKKGFVVTSSSSVSDAKRRLGEEAFDLVISDLQSVRSAVALPHLIYCCCLQGSLPVYLVD